MRECARCGARTEQVDEKSRCVPCQHELEKMREWRKANPEYFKRKRREHYQKNRDDILARAKKIYADNRDAMLAHNKIYYQQNRESIAAQKRARRLQSKLDWVRQCAVDDYNAGRRPSADKVVVRFRKDKDVLITEYNAAYRAANA